MSSRASLTWVALAVLGLAGCSAVPIDDPVWTGPFYTPTNFAGEPGLPAELRRVVVLPVHAGALAPVETAESLDPIIARALQAQQRFEVVTLSREDCRRWFGAGDFSSAAALPHGFLAQLASQFGADGVVFTDVTVYQPYRPQAIGLRSKLATVREVRLLWTFDEVISAADPGVANSARRRFLKTDRVTQPLDLSPSALQSPSRFAQFAAEVMFATLPPR
jgi:hypothetical protein